MKVSELVTIAVFKHDNITLNGLPMITQQQFGLRYLLTCYLQGIVMGTEYY